MNWYLMNHEDMVTLGRISGNLAKLANSDGRFQLVDDLMGLAEELQRIQHRVFETPEGSDK